MKDTKCRLKDLHTYQYFIKFNIFQPLPLGVQKQIRQE